MNEETYLFNERPLVIRPELAKGVGLNESIFLQQLNYWLKKSNHEINGRKWVYNTYKSWHEQMPFFSLSTLKRTIWSLQKSNYIIVDKFNKAGFDKTNWYTIDYKNLSRGVNQRLVQNEPTSGSKRTNGEGQNEPTNTIDYTETTTENTTTNMSSSDEHDHSAAREVISYLNKQAGKHFRNTASNYRLIEPRLKEYSVNDLKQVIDNKCAEWLNTDMDKYLRIETLFRASKIDGYLNEKPKKGHDVDGLDF